ncbi:MAG: pyruvate dehydrogenase complex dihydrolipoamide acetyltransferase [Pyrinomonadaceae bacterium]
MATKVVMPKLSPTMEEGQLARWLKAEGDKVSMGEPIAEIDTDKATMEMQALSEGVLRKILIKEGESAPLGQMIAIVGKADEDISALLAEAAATPAVSKAVEAAPAPAEEAKPTAPAENAAAVPAAAAPTAASNGHAELGGRIVISPLAARMAAEANLNARDIKGTGPAGRIIKRDVEAAMKAGTATPSAAKASREFVLPEIEGASAYRDEPATEMRRTIARRLVTSIGPVPHFFLTIEVEMDQLAAARKAVNEANPEIKLSLNDFIVKITANALVNHPQVNASYQDKTVRYYESADIGVAVAVEDGLITPIIRGANNKGVAAISAEIKEKAERARHRKLRPEEYTGATFSISNLGMFGIEEFTAIINPPEAGILAIGAVTAKPVVRDGEMVVRQMMRITMSCDHRVIDGATGAKFLQTLKRYLENPIYVLV